ncbi:unnamed protein product [Calicophoron daubneyi]|uniref:F-box domain-containing protein n=1 Tax=Calicophoron daubneyi TaxID=300641 RepID=A0AAV2TGB8_CALDB
MAAMSYENPLFEYYNLFKDGRITEMASVAPAPQRDFHHLLITTSTFIWRSWKITSRNDGAKYHPAESRATHDEFLTDERMQSDILRVLGPETLDYCKNIARGFVDFIERIPYDLLKNILFYLNLEDIVNLSYVSKRLHKLCNDDDVWKEIYVKNSHSSINDTIEELAKLFGWKRVFFTSKLQLQMQLHRLRMEQAEGNGDVTEFDENGLEIDDAAVTDYEHFVGSPSGQEVPDPKKIPDG